MTSENDKVISATRGERTHRIVIDSHSGWTTVFEKWEEGVVTRKYIAPEHIKYRSISRVIAEDERYEFDWEEGTVVDRAKKQQ